MPPEVAVERIRNVELRRHKVLEKGLHNIRRGAVQKVVPAPADQSHARVRQYIAGYMVNPSQFKILQKHDGSHNYSNGDGYEMSGSCSIRETGSRKRIDPTHSGTRATSQLVTIDP